jgi:hypothetical protein
MKYLIVRLRRGPDEPERNPDAGISSDSHVWIMELTK